MHNRADRMGDEIRRILADIIAKKLNDPRITGIVSLTSVVMSRDLSTARVFYSVYGGEDESKGAQEAFKKAGGFLRRELASQIISRKVPRLVFVEDTSIRDGMAMDELIRRVREADASSGDKEKA